MNLVEFMTQPDHSSVHRRGGLTSSAALDLWYDQRPESQYRGWDSLREGGGGGE